MGKAQYVPLTQFSTTSGKTLNALPANANPPTKIITTYPNRNNSYASSDLSLLNI